MSMPQSPCLSAMSSSTHTAATLLFNESENHLEIANILSAGFGTIPQSVMRDKRITPEARLLYSYLCSFTGQGRTSYPSTSSILEELCWGKKKFYAAREELVAIGLVQVAIKSKSEGGRICVYELPLEIDLNKAGFTDKASAKSGSQRAVNFTTHEKTRKFRYGDFGSEKPSAAVNVKNTNRAGENTNRAKFSTREKSYQQSRKFRYGDFGSKFSTRSNKIPGQTRKFCYGDFGFSYIFFKKYIYQSISQSISYKENLTEADFAALSECESEAEAIERLTDGLKSSDKESFISQSQHLIESFEKLCNMSLKPVSPNDATETLIIWLDCLKAGYSATGICKAYTRYLARYRKDNPDTVRFAKQLKNYLTNSDGLAFDCPITPAEGSGVNNSCACSAKPNASHAIINAYIADDNPQFRAWYDELSDKIQQRQSLMAQPNLDQRQTSQLEFEIEELKKQINKTREEWLNSEHGKQIVSGMN